ncbi:hypothetical protein [Methanosarcina horonobensis]|uniref:hypothetical protein n=1 Tax=Methanosarcina horonobensis TaxID=418008 RepID=UPI000A53E1E4|nr:hypothetical protein [Methanosarcina horonobensis]
MQQKDVIISQLANSQLTIRQLAQTVTDFLEPVIPYLVIGSKKKRTKKLSKSRT